MPRANKRTAKLASAIQRAQPPALAPTGPKFNPPTGPKNKNPTGPRAQTQNFQNKNQSQSQKKPDPEISIRRLAGPFSVLMQNFAPGTTAADIESVMTPVGGEMLSCRVVKTRPFMLAELVFGSREAGDRVIASFDGKTVWTPFIPLSRDKQKKLTKYRRTAASSKCTPTRRGTSPRRRDAARRARWRRRRSLTARWALLRGPRRGPRAMGAAGGCIATI
ncbi:hypothetical protein IMZ48_20565 [Candidatus Bathyarchaeota archaeon]|nr:hypothetical protein [Candidatus Bathyarchaeota archaeon]